MVNGDVVPIGEIAADPDGADRVVPGEVVERLGRQNHAPAEGVVGAVALDDGHLVRAVAQLHRYGKVEAGRSTAENRNLHACVLLMTTRIMRPSRQYFKLKISRVRAF